MVSKLFAASRYLILLAVVGSLLAATLVMLFGIYDLFRIFLNIVQGNVYAEDVTKKVSVGAIELIELFLLGTVLYVVSLGLYQLFIEKEIPVPAWLKISTLDNLKERLLATVLVMIAVSFFGYAVTWDGSWNILAIGLAIGFVIIGIAYTLARAIHDKEPSEENGREA
ncbi:YqhA family protein [Anaerolineae bacterium CFX7]|nr:YqhA family protein [Anaerolineae bacterium CFX7]